MDRQGRKQGIIRPSNLCEAREGHKLQWRRRRLGRLRLREGARGGRGVECGRSRGRAGVPDLVQCFMLGWLFCFSKVFK